MLYSTFITIIPKLKAAALAGIDAQFVLAPEYRKKYKLEKIKAQSTLKASVLIIFFPNENGEASFILTKRASYDGYHSKQISFPGGKKDIKDRSLLHTAIRETEEEIGIHIAPKNVFKELTEVYIPPSNFLVQPFVSILNTTPVASANYEVDKVITPTLSDLLNPKNIKYSTVNTYSKEEVKAPGFIFENEVVWGATAMILSELRQIILSLTTDF